MFVGNNFAVVAGQLMQERVFSGSQVNLFSFHLHLMRIIIDGDISADENG